jgi:hypothetical protein
MCVCACSDKESLTTSASESRPYEYMPVGNASSNYQPLPEGLIFMQDANASVAEQCSASDASFPKLANDPGVDRWKLGAPVEGVPDKATWQQQRVFRDILEHRMTDQTEEQKEQWRALHAFHNKFETADSVPTLPVQLTTANGSCFSMNHGSPVGWKEGWASLAWRFDRPHKPQPPVAVAAGQQLQPAAPPPAPPPAHQLPRMINQATGGNNRRQKKKNEQRDDAVDAKANSLSATGLSSPKQHQLAFAVTPTPEGEFSVGLARIEEVLSDSVRIAWFRRKNDEDFEWPDNPVFEPCKLGNGRIEIQDVEAETLLSVPVELTKASQDAWKGTAKSIAGQFPKLKKDCVTLLRTFLELKRKDLIAEPEPEEDE